MEFGECKLCLKQKPLVNSHLMARGLYDLCRPPDGDPIFVSNKVIMQSGRQLQHPLLCEQCDASLGRYGEDWLLPLLATIDGRFPLLDVLQKVPAEVADGDSKMYAASRSPEIDTSKFTHFAMGVFWKASIHSWSGSGAAPLIDLGEYGELVRVFLIGETPFPRDMVLVVGVSPSPVKIVSFHYPYQGSESTYRNFLFYVPGVEFALLVGRTVPDESRQTCFATHPLHPVLVCDLTPVIKDVIQTSTKKAHLAKNVEQYLKTNRS